MANFVKQGSVSGGTTKHGGAMSYAKDDRFTDIICEACKKNQLTPIQLKFCTKRGIPNLCFNCQRTEGYTK